MALSSELKVGALFFVGLGLSVWFTFQTSKRGNTIGEFKVDFQRVARLSPGDPVLYNGVRIGKVASVAPIIEQGLPRVQVAFSVDGPARPAVLIGKESLVRINQGLLGGASMEIISEGGQPISPANVESVTSLDPASFDEVVRSLQDILDENREGVKGTVASARKALENFASASEQIRAVVEENRASLKSTIANAEQLTGELKGIAAENRETLKASIANAERMTREIADLVAENRATVKAALERIEAASGQVAALVEENRRNIQNTTAKLPGAVDNLSQAAGQIRDAVAENRDDLRSTMLGVAAFAPKLDRIGDNLEKITAQVASGKGTVGRLVFEDTIHDQASSVLTSAQERMDEIKPFTQGISELKLYAGLEGGSNVDSGMMLGEGYLRIEPRSWKFYQAGASYRWAPTDRKVEKDDPNKLGVDFSLLIGWRFMPDDGIERYRLSVAGGLIETRLGGWADVAITRDLDIRLMARLKHNDREPTDRRYEHGDAMVRATASYRMFDRIYAIAGWDDCTGQDAGPWFALRAELLDNDLRNLSTASSIAR